MFSPCYHYLIPCAPLLFACGTSFSWPSFCLWQFGKKQQQQQPICYHTYVSSVFPKDVKHFFHNFWAEFWQQGCSSCTLSGLWINAADRTYLDLNCWMRQQCKLINLFLPRRSRVIVPELNKCLERDLLPHHCLHPHILEQYRHYSRTDFAGESVSQDQGNGGENRHGGAHCPDPGDLRASGATASQSTAVSFIRRLEWWWAAAFVAEHSRLFLSSLLALNHGWGD